MIDLLKKYPFLVYRNVFSGKKSHDTLDEDIEYNQWTSWDGSIWGKRIRNCKRELF